MPISLSKRIGPDSFSVVWGSLHLLHNEPVTFPALPVPIYTPGWRGVIMVKCLTQGHNTLAVTGLEPTTFCLWIQHWSARPHAPIRVTGHKGVKTKPQYSFLNLISKSSNKAPEKLVNAYSVSCNFYAGFWRISLCLPVYYAGLCFQFCRFSILALLTIVKLL